MAHDQEIQSLMSEVKDFAVLRNWEQFHTLKRNLSNVRLVPGHTNMERR
jgi:hypothetical protein